MFKQYIKTSDILPLPHSNGDYLVSSKGAVFNRQNEKLLTEFNCLGSPFVKIDWINGYKEYEIKDLVAFTFKPLYIPLDLWGEVEVVLKDDDPLNVSPVNLVWNFKRPIPCTTLPGTFYIPNFTRYSISINGDVFTVTSGNQRKIYVDKRNYRTVYIRLDSDQGVLVSRHRLMVATFGTFNPNYDDLMVNHINGVPGDDRIENLELITARENIIHAFKAGLMTTTIKVEVTNRETMEVEVFPSIAECARSLSLNIFFIRKELARNGSVLIDGYEINYHDHFKSTLKPNNRILVRHLSTNTVKRYETKKECYTDLDITFKELNSRLSRINQPVFHDNTQVKYVDDPTPWRVPSDPEEKFFKEHRTRVLVRNVDSGEILEFDSITECAKCQNLTKDAIVWRLNAPGETIWPERAQYKRKVDRSPWRIGDHQNTEIVGRWLKSVILRNVISGEILEFKKQRDCHQYLKIGESTLSIWLDIEGQPVFPGYWQMQRKATFKPWRSIKDPILELTNFTKLKAVEVRNWATKEVVVYTSCKECADAVKVKTTTLNWRLKSDGQKVYADGLQFRYYGDPTPWLD